MNERTETALAAARALVADADARIEVFTPLAHGCIVRPVPNPTADQRRRMDEAQRYFSSPDRF